MRKSFIAVIILTFGCLILFTKSSFAIDLPVRTEFKYEIIENQGSSGPISGAAIGWNTRLPTMVTDGQYVYILVLRGSYPVDYELVIKRKNLDSGNGWEEIWSRKEVMGVWGALVLDKNNNLHVFYYQIYSRSNYGAGFLHYEVSSSPRDATASFVSSPPPSAEGCNRCRLGLYYDWPSDTIHLVTDQTNRQTSFPYTLYFSKTGNAAWSSPEKILDYYMLTLTSSKEQGFYYAKPVVFNGKIHIFFMGNIADRVNSALRWFNGIPHYYRELTGGPWLKEWVEGPFTDEGEGTGLGDVYNISDNQLAIIASHAKVSSSGAVTLRETNLYSSTTGIGNWQKKVIISDKNEPGCVVKTGNGLYHLFINGFDKHYYQSLDGINWQLHPQISPPSTILSLVSATGCVDEQGLVLQEPYSFSLGYIPSQESSKTTHTIVFVKPQIIPTATNTPTPSPNILRGDLDTNGKVDIFDYNLLVTDFGKTGAVGFSTADIDQNGVVDIFDYNIFLTR